MNFKTMQDEVHGLAVTKGWYEGVPDAHDATWIGARLALIHSEVSEALEAVRRGRMTEYRSDTGKPEGLPSELADIIIRVMDLAGSLGIDLEEAVASKHAFNTTRPHRHGGKAL